MCTNVHAVFSQDQSEYNSTTVRSQTNTVVIRGLRPGSIYVFQVRARTVAGFGRYSGKLYFQTMTEGENSYSYLSPLMLIDTCDIVMIQTAAGIRVVIVFIMCFSVSGNIRQTMLVLLCIKNTRVLSFMWDTNLHLDNPLDKV